MLLSGGEVAVRRSTTRGTVSTSRLSVQLYTVRELVAEDLLGTLGRLADLGLTQVEPYGVVDTAEELGRALEATGLSAPTAHQRYLDRSPEELDAVFAAAAGLGIATLIDPHVERPHWQRREDVEATAARLNAAAGIAARHGVRVGYHNHAHELESLFEGTTALEVFAAALDDGVALEVDTYWAAVGGQDPVALLGRLGARVEALHVKDGPVSTDNRDQVAVGSGTLPIRAIVEAAPDALRVIELDDSREDRMTAVADSVAWLTAQGLA